MAPKPRIITTSSGQNVFSYKYHKIRIGDKVII
jgi:hypothetical protein